MGKQKRDDAPRKKETKQVRLYPGDADDLGKLAALRGDDSAAATFRELFGDLLRSHLIDALATEGRRLKQRNPDV